MIRIYPYPFSKHVKSLPDPPPAKPREIKHFECKKYENNYSWLLEAKSNLKKCFHLCNFCSKRFNYMRCVVKNSNMHYEYNLNNKILKNKLKEDAQLREDIYDINLHDNNKTYDVKNNILKINSNKLRNNTYSNESFENIKTIKNSSIIFSNSLNHNKNESLSFNDDVYIFVDDYSKEKSKDCKRDEESCINKNSEDMNILKHDIILSKYKPENMIIHIKRHFRNNISYFACEHLKSNDLYNLNDENNNYDNINIYMYDNDREDFMSDCIINLNDENELYSISQSCVINGVDKNRKESQKEQNNTKNIYNTKFRNSFSLRKNKLKEKNLENNINHITQINENCKLLNTSSSLNNKGFDILSHVKERTKMNDIILHINEDKKNSKNVYSFFQNDKKNNKLMCDSISKDMYFKNFKNSHKNSKNYLEIIFDNKVNENMDFNDKNKLHPLHKIDGDAEENVIPLYKKDFHFNNLLKEKKRNENCESDNINIIITNDYVDGNKNDGITKNFNSCDDNYENRVSKNYSNEKHLSKYNVKKENKSINLNKEMSSRRLIDELNGRLIERKNFYLENNEGTNKNISCILIQKEKEKRVVNESTGDFINNKNHFKDVLKNNLASIKKSMNLLNVYKKSMKKTKTINNVNIDEFKNKLINDMTSVSNIQKNKIQKSAALDDETKKRKENGKIKNYYDKELKKKFFYTDVDYFKAGVNFINNKGSEIDTKKGNLKEVHEETNDNTCAQNYNIEIKSLTIDEKQKSNNIKLLKQIKRNNYMEENVMDENKIKSDYSHFGQVEQVYEKKNINNIVYDQILDINKDKKYKEVKNKEETIFNDNLKNKYFNNKNSLNLKCIHKKDTNEISLKKEDNIMKTLNEIGNDDGNKKCINKSYNSYSDNKINDNIGSDKNNNGKSSTLQNNIFNSFIKNCECGTRNCENYQIKSELTEINYSNIKKYNDDFRRENIHISKKDESDSINSWSDNTSISVSKTTFSNELNLNNNKDYLFRKNKLDIHYLNNKIHFNQNKDENIKYNNVIDRSKKADKQQNKENEVNKIEYDEKLNKNMKNKLGSILSMYTNPSKINIHNKIYTSDIEKNNLDNKKVIYINNNYFFNVDKDNYFENGSGKFPENSMKCNFKKFDLQFCKNNNDFYSFKYMSNVLSSSCSLSKEYIFSESYESNILEEKFHKLNDLRNKYLLKKCLTKVLDKKKIQSINSTNKKISSMNQRKLKCNMRKNTYDKNLKNDNKFNLIKKFNDALNIKQKIERNFKISKEDTNLYEAPKSPKKQDKIPKPLASQLEINSLSYLKKTPSYPFEEFNF
ncbi:conserved Plasmodium protein, unknown function [Plasmodium gallinaceum]|uniref:Uncharacterized protein n=1 Tax=Plasmodium gallinaceum TaxID=5849 RepID=A0A1J1GL37_PLAGA|nr:conserved Plasmodium protein, unknown function [Plasmodium gallinaceum]CRG93110.1 conserved Plasmodium protein, unknown function [Plasmodium gallinaceum]